MVAPRFSACVEWLFAAEASNLPDRIRLAAAAGLPAVEFWLNRGRDLDAIAASLQETGLALTSIVADPIVPLVDPLAAERFLQSIRDTLPVAQRLGAPVIIVQSGDVQPGETRAVQRSAMVATLGAAAGLLSGTGVVLALEPLNDRLDHPGYYLTSTSEGLDVVDAVDRPEVRLLYDVYHSAMMGEGTGEVLAGRVDRLAHVHLADLAGRGEPGSGPLDFAERLTWIYEQGYAGFVGLEYRPTVGTLDSLAKLRTAFPNSWR